MNINNIKKLDYYIGYLLILIFWPFNFLIGFVLNFIPSGIFKKNIVFLKIVGGGSLLIAAPSIFAIKKQYPTYKMVLLCSNSVVSFARTMGIFDEIYVVSLKNPITLIYSFLKIFGRIICSEFIVNLEIYSKLSSLVVLYTLSKNRIGLYLNYNKWQSGLINSPIYMNSQHPVHEAYANIAHKLNCKSIEFAYFKKYFKYFNKLKIHKITNEIAIAPFCSDIYTERELNPSQIKSIISELKLSKNVSYIILGGNNDLDKSKQLEEELIKLNMDVKNMVGITSIMEVIHILSSVKLLITIDSGILHLARLIGTQTLSYWGPSDPALRLLGSVNNDKFIYKRINCSPCVHTLDIAPCRGNNLCMKQYFETIPKRIFWQIR